MPLSAFQQIPPRMRGVSVKASFGAINSVTGHGFTVLDTRLLPVRLGSHTIWVAFSICEEEISILGMDAIARLALSLAGDGCTTLRSSRCAFVKISSDDAAVNLWQPLPKHSATPPRVAAAAHSGRNGPPPELAATVATSADVEPYASSPVKITITDADTGVPPIATHCLVEAFGFAHHVITDCRGQGFIMLTNTTPSPINLRPGQLIGDGECIRPSKTFRAAPAVIASLMAASSPPLQRTVSDTEYKRIIFDATVSSDPLLRDAVRAILFDFRDVISANKYDLGRTDTMEHEIVVRDNEPVWRPNFRIPDADLDFVKNAAKEWLRLGLIRPSRSNYNAALFCVRKKDGSLRVVLDYRALNQKTLPAKYLLRTVDECIAEIGRLKSKVFSMLDLTSGFWQVPLKEEHRHLSAFTVGQQQYEWNVMPMGHTSSPSQFARLMDLIMAPLPNVLCYIDDVLIHSPSIEEHLLHLRQALHQLRTHKLKINIAKCEFGAKEAVYLGHTVSADGVRPGKDKAEDIRLSEPPSDKESILRFVGLCNYFRHYVPNFSILSSQLTRLTRKDVPWDGGALPPPALDAFKKLRLALTSRPVLQYPNADKPFHLYVDASLGEAEFDGGLGAVLMQPDDSSPPVHLPVAYASRSLTKAEKNYPAFLAEKLAARWGMQHFRHYLIGRKFTLHTDHKPLLSLSRVHSKTDAKFDDDLAEFDFVVSHIPGKDNVVADYLSRHVIPKAQQKLQETPTATSDFEGVHIAAIDCSFNHFHFMQQQHPPFVDIITRIKQNNDDIPVWALRCHVHNDTLVIRHHGRILPVAPPAMHTDLLRTAHADLYSGHTGAKKSILRLLNYTWWFSMAKDMAAFVRNCTRCQALRPTQQATPTRPVPLPQCSLPNERVHMDLLGPLKQGNASYYVIVMTDAFTKYTLLSSSLTKSGPAIAAVVQATWIATFGVPVQVVTDQGNEWTNHMLQHLWQRLGISHRKTTPYHPQSNGQAEVFNKTIKRYLATLSTEAQQAWRQYLPHLQLAYNSAHHEAIDMSPFKALFGYDPRIPQLDDPTPIPRARSPQQVLAEAVLARLRRTRGLVQQNNTGYRHTRQAALRRRQPADPTTFTVGQWVLCKRQHKKTDVNPKIAPSWYGPGRVLTVDARLQTATILIAPEDSTKVASRNVNWCDLRPFQH